MVAIPFNNLITFSRGSNATVTGPSGLIQWAPNNLLTFSEQFDNVAWSKQNATITTNNTTAPDGTITADKLIDNAVNNAHYVTPGAGVALPAGIFTFSAYIKQAELSAANLYFDATGSGVAYFNLVDGTVVVTAGAIVDTATITPVGNGWYRCTITTKNIAAATRYPVIGAGNPASYAGAGNGIFIWGAQLELGSTATTYNPTTVKNLLGFSEAFDNAAWTKVQTSIVTGAQANPVNGLFNAQKLMENTATNVHRVQQGFTTTTGATYTFSCYAKAAERSWVYLYDDAANAFAYFNVANGTVGTVGAGWTSTSITSVGNGWYRISGTATEASGGAGNQLIGIAAVNGTASYTGDGNSGVYIYGAQLSDSASLDPYVPTPGAAPSSTAFYGPRFDFDPVTLQPRGLLVEEQRTNLALTSSFGTLAGSAGSQYPSGTGWSNLFNTGGTRTYVSSAVFSGAQAMDIALVSTARNVIAFSFTPAASTTYAVSFYVESVSGVTGAVAYATGSLGTGGTTNSVSAPTATGRYTYTFTTGTTPGTVDLRFGIGAAGNENGSIRISNVQVEAGAFATSYIPTIASTVTRSADVATITGQNFAQWFANSEGTFAVEANMFSVNTGDRRILGINNIPAAAAFVSSGAGLGIFDGTIVAASGAVTANTPFKGATAFDSTTKYAVRNGGAVANGARSVTFPLTPGSSIQLGFEGGGGNYLNGHIRNIRFIPARAAEFQLQALST